MAKLPLCALVKRYVEEGLSMKSTDSASNRHALSAWTLWPGGDRTSIGVAWAFSTVSDLFRQSGVNARDVPVWSKSATYRNRPKWAMSERDICIELAQANSTMLFLGCTSNSL